MTGTATATIRVSDGIASATSTLAFQITASAPLAADETATVNEDGQVTVDVLANDSPGLTLTGIGTPGAGTARITDDGQILYTPNPDAFGSDSLSYTAHAGDGQTVTGRLDLVINPVDDAPVFVGDVTAFEIPEGTRAVTDIDSAPDAIGFTITGGGDADAFIVDPMTGRLSFATAPSVDADTAFAVEVTASSESAGATRAISVSVRGTTPVTGAAGRETPTGGDGAQRLDTGGGIGDKLIGGANADVFVFINAADG